jgi:hypothetical protein
MINETEKEIARLRKELSDKLDGGMKLWEYNKYYIKIGLLYASIGKTMPGERELITI